MWTSPSVSCVESPVPPAAVREAWPWSTMGGALLVLVATVALLMAAPSAAAQDRGRGGQGGRGAQSGHDRGYQADRGGQRDRGDRGRRDGVSFSIGYEQGGRGNDRFRAGVSYRQGFERYQHRGFQSYRVSDRNRGRAYRSGYVAYRGNDCGYGVATPYYRPTYRHPPRGQWQRVWCPPVYRTVYDPCGTARQVCIRAGYYRTVYVQVNVGTGY